MQRGKTTIINLLRAMKTIFDYVAIVHVGVTCGEKDTRREHEHRAGTPSRNSQSSIVPLQVVRVRAMVVHDREEGRVTLFSA